MTRTLEDWLARLERAHPKSIDLGLERVRDVAARMALPRPAPCVITVGGTNGKGSTVAFIESIARAAGLRVGAYTSPHLLRYNERVRIDGQDASDVDLVAAFEAVEAARGDVSLTYFEAGTLAAMHLFARAGLDLAVLEVGLGGRLDAVNIVDADVAVITTVDLDHQDWLGNDREAIGTEKAGIARAGKPLVLGDDDPPASVLRRAYALGASAIRINSDFFFGPRDLGHWHWRELGFELELPMPGLAAPVQLRNAAIAIAALRASTLEIPERAWAKGIAGTCVPGRLQHVAWRGIDLWLDVGHNPQAACALAQWAASTPIPGRTHALYAALADKDAVAVVHAMAPVVDAWHLAGLSDAGLRGQSVETLAQRLGATAATSASNHVSIGDALRTIREWAEPGDRVLVFGSFHTVSEAFATIGSAAGAEPG